MPSSSASSVRRVELWLSLTELPRLSPSLRVSLRLCLWLSLWPDDLVLLQLLLSV